MTQGDLSIDAYCQKMKTTVDALHDVSHTVIESQLVLNLLRGLKPQFSSTADNIADSTPLPNFTTAREKLILKELRLANKGQVTSQTALLAGSSCSSACHASMGSQGASGSSGRPGNTGSNHGTRPGNDSSGGGSYHNRQKGRGGRGGSSQGGSHGPPQPAGPWVSFSPWGGYQQQWRPHSGPDVLGTPPQAHTAFAAAQYSDGALPPQPQPGAGPWNQARLVAALNQLSFQGSNPWVLDKDASTHVTLGWYTPLLPPSL